MYIISTLLHIQLNSKQGSIKVDKLKILPCSKSTYPLMMAVPVRHFFKVLTFAYQSFLSPRVFGF